MRDQKEIREPRLFPKAINARAIAGMLLLATLASCASQSGTDAAVAEAEQAAMQQQAAQLAAEAERARAAELQRQREREQAERARAQAERDRQLAQAQARAEAEREQREAAERRERARLAALAAAQAEREAKLERIAELEQQIASFQAEVSDDAERTASMALAIDAAEDLLAALTQEQAKYENTDEQGNTVEPLEKELIAELESRKNELVQQAGSQ
ncbi:MAG: hypothetical protein WDZ52_11805 [Pseudohongiellaceae bacterium]